MKCLNCGGALHQPFTHCPYCQVRPDIDLRHVHFRDLGEDASMLCPYCIVKPLHRIELETTPAMHIERCNDCRGMFFNPGELEAVLSAQIHPVVWVDPVQLNQIAADYGYTHQVIYRKCPVCSERMSHLNFGGKSGVILDRCGTHGLWAEGAELRRLTEWWRAGGKHLHQKNEVKVAARMDELARPGVPMMPTQTKEYEIPDLTYAPEIIELTWRAIGAIASSITGD